MFCSITGCVLQWELCPWTMPACDAAAADRGVPSTVGEARMADVLTALNDLRVTVGGMDTKLTGLDTNMTGLMALHHAAAHNTRCRLRNARALAYDLVYNGVEIGGGSLRIYRRDLQQVRGPPAPPFFPSSLLPPSLMCWAWAP